MLSNDLCKLLFGHLALPHLKECSYYSSYHIAQETVGTNGEDSMSIFEFFPLGLREVADGGFNIGVRAAERCKILFANEQQSSLVHGCVIQWLAQTGSVWQ